MRWPLQLASISLALVAISLGLKMGLPESGTAQRGFPFMVILSGMGLVASLWLWFLRRPRTNGMLAFFVLGNMACVALMIIPPAVYWTAFRRGNDPQPINLPPPPTPVEAMPISPATLPALGFLPDDCNLVAGIHVAELCGDPAGKKLLAGTETGEPPSWLIEMAVGRVEKLTGMKPEVVDHVVVGTHIDTGLPQLMIVVRTRKPYDPAVVAKAQAPAVPSHHAGRDLYQFSSPQGMLFCADTQTLVVILRIDAVAQRDKQLLTTAPRTGTNCAPPQVRTLIAERLGGTQLWWTAAEIQRPGLIGGLLPLGERNADLTKQLQGVKAVTFWDCVFHHPGSPLKLTFWAAWNVPTRRRRGVWRRCWKRRRWLASVHQKSSRRPSTAETVL